MVGVSRHVATTGADGRRERDTNLSSMEAAHSPPRLGSNASPFPRGAIVVLALCMAVHSYTFVSLFPYAGKMVTELLDLESTNNSGELCRM